MSKDYKADDSLWLAEKEYFNESPCCVGGREMRYKITPVRYIYPSRCEGRHWVTTLVSHPDVEFVSQSYPRLLQSVVTKQLREVDGKWLFLTKEDAERAEELDRRLEKLETSPTEYKCWFKNPEDAEKLTGK